jgi:hypothetical protein
MSFADDARSAEIEKLQQKEKKTVELEVEVQSLRQFLQSERGAAAKKLEELNRLLVCQPEFFFRKYFSSTNKKVVDHCIC